MATQVPEDEQQSAAKSSENGSLPNAGVPASPRNGPPPLARPVSSADAPLTTVSTTVYPAVQAQRVSQPKTAQEPTHGRDEGHQMAAEWLRMAPAWLASTVVHIIILLVMALWFMPVQTKERLDLVVAAPNDAPLEDLQSEADLRPIDDNQLDSSEMPHEAQAIDPSDVPSFSEVIGDQLAANTTLDIDPNSALLSGPAIISSRVAQGPGTSIAGYRGAANRGTLIKQHGGNEASEAAVARALKWLAEQQLKDGGWNFDLRKNRNANGGRADKARNGATAMALLPFLGAGHTHLEGKYKTEVYNGLTYLMKHMQQQRTRYGQGASWHEPQGTMYSHGLSAIVICEAYAMTHDKALEPYAQAAVNFIAAAQAADGGWRYEPGQPGDTSVVGWQIMALKSGHMGYLNVPRETVERAYGFLDKVQTDYGTFYGYTGPGKGDATTAIGLLCRMYLGWKKEHPALQRGVEWISNKGPSTGPRANMYYNYYATQVIRHWEGEEWEKWNKTMRDYLIQTQAMQGPEAGSWYFNDPSDHGERGQRLYTTSLATMILEVYYRHLPIFQKQSTEGEFKP
jgi:squalene-hopene cyclase-like protein